VIPTDFMPDKEFHPIFDRVSAVVDLKGAGTPAEINKRLREKIRAYETQEGKRLNPVRTKRLISQLRGLMFAGFGRRTIDEAVANPQGKVALTLKYGREKAKDILLARARRRIGRPRRLS